MKAGNSGSEGSAGPSPASSIPTGGGPGAARLGRVPEPQALVFDVDGTLFDTLPAIHRALNDALSAAGVAPAGMPLVRERVSAGFEALVRSCLEGASTGSAGSLRSNADPRSPAAGNPLATPACVAAVHRDFLERYAALVPGWARAYPGTDDLLAALARRGRRLAICSNAPGALIDALLVRAGWSRRFETVVHADNAARLKPSAEPLLQALAAMGIRRAEDAWLVGDSAMDSGCAAAAGSGFVWFSSGYGQPGKGDPVLARIGRPAELLGLLE